MTPPEHVEYTLLYSTPTAVMRAVSLQDVTVASCRRTQ